MRIDRTVNAWTKEKIEAKRETSKRRNDETEGCEEEDDRTKIQIDERA